MKKHKKRFLGKEKGITLIALVITIIVLLILAGVSIAMLTGENGILTQAQNAKNKTEEAARKEEQDLAELEAIVKGEDIVITPVHDNNPGELEQEGSDTFVINSIEDLVFFSHDVTNGNDYNGKTVKLGINLDFNSDKSCVDPNSTDYAGYGYNGPLKQTLTSGTGFNLIGGQDGTNSFYGTFDGDNKAICSMYININSDENVKAGLFSTSCGEIRNLGLVNTNITVQGNQACVGGITGNSYNNIYDSYVTGNINITGNSWTTAGGLCGNMIEEANIENCYNLANINATNIKEGWGSADISCGGILGQGKANINKCYNKGNISANGGDNSIGIGGICGHLDNGYIKNCYNNAEVKEMGNQTQGESAIGGIVSASSVDNITNCYNSGIVIGDIYGARIGGILGHQDIVGTISNTFNIGEIKLENQDTSTGYDYVGGIIGVAGGSDKYHADISNAYNVGKISIETPKGRIGSIAGTNWANVMSYNNCYYLTGTYEVGVDSQGGSYTGITELDSIDKFPSVLSVVNGDSAFKEDSNNINNGYPILEWQ